AAVFVPAMDTGRMVECRQGAAQALRSARTKVAWDAADGYTVHWNGDHMDAAAPGAFNGPGRVRLRLKEDSISPADDFDGSPRDLQEARDRASRDGMWGVCAEFWNGVEWVEVDATWGFIGDDWKGSGYDVDLMQSAL